MPGLGGFGQALDTGLGFYGSGYAKPTDALRFESVMRGGAADPLATETRNFLLKRLRTSAKDSEMFQALAGTARRGIFQAGNVGRRNVRDALGSSRSSKGLLARTEAEITRGEQEATAVATAEILVGLEALRDQGIFEFLSIEAQENLGLGQLQQLEEARRQRAQLAQAGMIAGSGGFGSGTGGISTGPSFI